MRRFRYIVFAIIFSVVAAVLFPAKELLIPAMDVTVRYADGTLVVHGEVSRTWNHYLGPGWTNTVEKTNQDGIVRFPEVTRRVPLLVKAYKAVFGSLFEHQYAGMAGDLVGRDANNHLIWQRVDFDDRNCCPFEVVITTHETEGEAEDDYFYLP